MQAIRTIDYIIDEPKRDTLRTPLFGLFSLCNHLRRFCLYTVIRHSRLTLICDIINWILSSTSGVALCKPSISPTIQTDYAMRFPAANSDSSCSLQIFPTQKMKRSSLDADTERLKAKTYVIYRNIKPPEFLTCITYKWCIFH